LRLHDWVSDFLIGLPALQGSPIALKFQPELTACRGKLLSGRPERGRAVHAASFLIERQIVLERRLLSEKDELRLILTHELFHFIWRKLGNRRRAEYESLVEEEHRNRARGELGESSGVAQEVLTDEDRALRSKRWKNYVCESFCDTGAWLYAGVARNEHFRLAEKWKQMRARWLASLSGFRV
jgi:hypothetical protein